MKLARVEVCFERLFERCTASLTTDPGIYGPGYEERRKQRIKENYGIDVPEPYYKKK